MDEVKRASDAPAEQASDQAGSSAMANEVANQVRDYQAGAGRTNTASASEREQATTTLDTSGDIYGSAGVISSGKITLSQPTESQGPTSSELGYRRVLGVDVRLAGVQPGDDQVGQTGFAVAGKGDSATDRTVATTAHALFGGTPNETGRYKYLNNLFDNADGDRNGTLSRSEIRERVETAAPPDDGSEQAGNLRFQSDYILRNYDRIAAESGGTEITKQGLENHYLRNAQITVQTSSGDVPAQVSGVDRNTDVSTLRLSNLTPEQTQAVGRNFQLGSAPAPRDGVLAVGYPGGGQSANAFRFRPIESPGRIPENGRPSPLISGPSFEMTATSQLGMSGGPILNARGEVVGLNHGIKDKTNIHSRSWGVPVESLRRLLDRQF